VALGYHSRQTLVKLIILCYKSEQTTNSEIEFIVNNYVRAHGQARMQEMELYAN